MSQTKQLLRNADASLKNASYDPRKLAAIHAGITIAACLLAEMLNYFLQLRIDELDGLSAMGDLALLQTVQSVAQSAVTILNPFWALGFTAAALGFARREQLRPNVLTKGLRRWGPVLRAYLLQFAIYFVLVLVSAQIGSFIYTMTPASAPLLELLDEETMADTGALLTMIESLDEETMMRIVSGMLPFLLVPMVLLVIPVAYLMRLYGYVLMDDPRCGAMYAIVRSFRLMWKNWRSFLKLDIRYLWYYLLEFVAVSLSYGALLLQIAGISLSVDATIVSLLFYVLSLAAQFGLYVWKKPHIATCYALLYDHVAQPETNA